MTIAEPELIALVHRKMANPKPVPVTAAIWHDLYIGGDDAYELLDEVAKRFGTSFVGFDFPAYFPNETEALSAFWRARFGFPRKFKRLTIDHLIAVIRRGEWFEPSN
jgi:hypothetical protein